MMGRIASLFSGFRRQRKSPPDEPEQARAVVSWVVAGLGNPGKEYAGSRHNTGYLVLDRIAQTRHVQFGRRRFQGATGEAEISGQRVLLVKPETYYNRSGDCISALLGYFKVPPERLIVIHDELDLKPGHIRIKSGGGDAGNNGVRSVVQSLGTPDFIRVRIGIGKPPPGDADHRHILGPVRRPETGDSTSVLDRAAQAVEAIVTQGLARAMGQYNQRTEP
jgi:peptidyl-tRNA hydrolase, PTH1 family